MSTDVTGHSIGLIFKMIYQRRTKVSSSVQFTSGSSATELSPVKSENFMHGYLGLQVVVYKP